MRKLLLMYFLIVIGLVFITPVNALIDLEMVAGAWLLDEGEDDEFVEDISGNENQMVRLQLEVGAENWTGR